MRTVTKVRTCVCAVGFCRKCNEAARYRRNKEARIKRSLQDNKEIKEQMILAYGSICACCGEAHKEFLTVDHINGDGKEHRKRCGTGMQVYRDLRRRGWPKDAYRLLCLNCNWSLGAFGYCPHKPNLKPLRRMQ